MEAKYPTPRGLINDLIRTITAAIVHMDDLFLNLDRNLEQFDDALLADQQLSMALGYLIELRSFYIDPIEQEQNNKNHNKNDTRDKLNLVNDFRTAIDIIIESLQMDYNNNIYNNININILDAVDIIDQIFKESHKKPSTYKSMNNNLRTNEINVSYNKEKNNIMLIGDQLCLLDDILSNHGYNVISCKTGIEAISLFKAHNGNFFLVIIDMCLPDISGHDLCRQFLSKNHDIKILFISGYDCVIVAKEIIDFKDCLILTKPFRLETLLKIIKHIKQK
jgi:CheY-like chemotaxis protein